MEIEYEEEMILRQSVLNANHSLMQNRDISFSGHSMNQFHLQHPYLINSALTNTKESGSEKSILNPSIQEAEAELTDEEMNSKKLSRREKKQRLNEESLDEYQIKELAKTSFLDQHHGVSKKENPVIELLDNSSDEDKVNDSVVLNEDKDALFDSPVNLSSENEPPACNSYTYQSRGLEILADVTLEHFQSYDNSLFRTPFSDEENAIESTKERIMMRLKDHMRKNSRKRKSLSKGLIHTEKDCIDSLPLLPCEPEFYPTTSLSTTISRQGSLLQPQEAPLDVKEPLYLSNISSTNLKHNYASFCEKWFPSKEELMTIMTKSRPKQTQIISEIPAPPSSSPDMQTITITSSIHDRLSKSVEPGVIEVLPPCIIYEEAYFEKHGKFPDKPMFCTQVAEYFSKSIIVCCSVCSTWRHIKCGGHHSSFSSRHFFDAFTPICDRCHLEESVSDEYPLAKSRIERQRLVHLRRTQAADAVLRSASYSKLGSYAWPLGSATDSQLSRQRKNVLMRFDKAEVNLKQMLHKIKGKDKVTASAGRFEELRRILHYVEDSEDKVLLHNAILFLQRDTQLRNPVGLERHTFNLFDPADDKLRLALRKERDESFDSNDEAWEEETDGDKSEKPDKADESKDHPTICIRVGCERQQRFDSCFCSDACGVSTMESDLLRTLKLAQRLPPEYLK